MAQRCPDCEAEFPSGEQCRERFDLCLAKELEHPATYGLVHHLTVICYMLQHQGYSRQGWLASRELLVKFMRQGQTPAGVRRQNRQRLDSGRRTWSVTRGERFSTVGVIWTRTIAGVRLDNAEVYQADITLWARAVLADTENLLRNQPV
ncbi:MAG: hypothetical protein DPW09_00730 [Anaerolineae bacterium]|nr:hypothetical protein [Anaerolineales bacterium]MCQ3971949.1 hypothetical protein [Anaerolineae bacterium]